MTLTKLHLAIAIAVIALIAPTTAVAVHIFDDVPDGAFYATSVEWAAANGITQGRTPNLFDPDAGVTRGESVTFLKRYDDNVVQPAIDAVPRGWDTIPPGVTVSGFEVWDLETAGGADYWFTVSFPGVAPAAPTDVNFSTDGSTATIDDDPTCTGSVADPTAPAGKVCLYLDGAFNAENVNGQVTAAAPTRGFLVNWTTPSAGDNGVWAAWAYTTPGPTAGSPANDMDTGSAPPNKTN